MNPQGSQIFNAAYFTALTAQVNAANSCAELQGAVNTLAASLNGTILGIQDQITLIAPVLALLTAPTSPTAAVTWITNFITDYLTPQLVPYATLAAQLTQLATDIAALTSAINAKAATFDSCSITIPPIPT